jgi:hypothetical protein
MTAVTNLSVGPLPVEMLRSVYSVQLAAVKNVLYVVTAVVSHRQRSFPQEIFDLPVLSLTLFDCSCQQKLV